MHELPLERRTLHGYFSSELEPVVTVEPGDAVAFSTLEAGWGVEPPHLDGSPRADFAGRTERDAGHALVGPIAVRGAESGDVLAVGIRRVRVGAWGRTVAAGWQSPLNERLRVADGDPRTLVWTLDGDAGFARDQQGRTVALAPFLGVIGMPPPEAGIHSTVPPRWCGGNIDCKELVEGSTLFLPVPVPGALLSAGDGHAAQGDGEVSSTAIECPLERVELTLGLREDLRLEAPIADTPSGWVTFGFDDDLDEAAAVAIEAMLDLLGRQLGVGRREALALASVVVDVRVTQLVNEAQGVHALLPHQALERLRG